MKIIFDREKSLKLSPPTYPVGIKQNKRLIINTGNLVKDAQIRVLSLNIDNTDEIIKSLKVNDWLYTTPVPVVTPTEKGMYRLICGYNRLQALTELGITSMIVDVVEGSPLRIHQYSYESNHVRNPRAANTIQDLVKGVKDAINDDLLVNDDDIVKSFIDVIAADKLPKIKKKIFDDFRKAIRRPGDSIKVYNKALVKEEAENLKIQYGGSKNKTITSHLGYITHYGLDKSIMRDGISSLFKAKGVINKIMLYAYVDNPDAIGLASQRQDVLDNITKVKKEWIEHYSHMLGKTTKQIEKDLVWPFEFGGFLPQNETKNPKNEGKPMESTLVDVNGDVFK